jgi:3-oxoacyl-[acyl-carrier-protein] synthase-1
MMPALAIKASGMVTAVGFNAPASLAAMRAGIRNVNETNVWDAETGTLLAAGKVPLPQWWVGLGKLADLAAPAILECFQAAKPVPAANIPVLLGVAPPDRPFRFAELESQILPAIEHRLGSRLHPASRVISRDHISVVAALRDAGDLIANKKALYVVVAAVDSLLDQDLADYYLEKRRLLTPINSNGFSLGEAGSAVLVKAADAGPDGELQILGMSLGREKATIESEEPLRGQGLTQVIREALREAGLTTQECHYRIADLNGEHYRFKEWALQTGRFVRKPTPKLFDLWHPIEFIGDVGAAIGPIILAVALHASQKGYGNGPTVLCTLSNDDGERAALVVNYHSPEKKP